MDVDFLKAKAQVTARIAKLKDQLAEAQSELEAFQKVEVIIRKQANNSAEPSILKLQSEIAAHIYNQTNVQTNGQGGHRGFFTQQIVETVTEAGKPVNAAYVKRTLLQKGYVPPGKNFDISVVKTLNRLAGSQGVLTKDKDKEGSVTFKAK